MTGSFSDYMVLNAIIYLGELLTRTMFDGEWQSKRPRLCTGRPCGARGHEINGAVRRCIKPNLLCKRHTIATVTGHHRSPDCTLHDVETVLE